MKITITEKQLKLILSKEIENLDEVSTPDTTSTPTSTTSPDLSSAPSSSSSSSLSTSSSSSSSTGSGTDSTASSYPQVTKWESGATRGPANQIGNTKWSDIVGSTITRGKANPLT